MHTLRFYARNLIVDSRELRIVGIETGKARGYRSPVRIIAPRIGHGRTIDLSCVAVRQSRFHVFSGFIGEVLR